MTDPSQFEEDYHRFISDLTTWLPDGIIEVNLRLLNELGLLEEEKWKDKQKEKFPHYFHVIESAEKVTLYNEQFIIWIVPQSINNQSITSTFIAFIIGGHPRLEIAFCTQGIYNNPKCILKVLNHYLEDVIDIQNVITSMSKA